MTWSNMPSGERVAPTPTYRVRAVAVGNRFDVAAATEENFVAELARVVGLAAPYLVSDRPNLLVLGELLGLPGALVGRRGGLARRATTARGALTLLALAYLPRVLHYRRRWPGVSLARALLLARTDALYRSFAAALARQAALHATHVVATTLAPRVRRSLDPADIARFGRPGAGEVYLPTGPEVYNAALVFGPDGTQLGRVDKVFLTADERRLLDLTPGRLEDVPVIATAAGRLGVAISLDAFTPAYLRHLAAHGAEIVVQPDANDQLWTAPSQTCDWQPQEWLNAVLGSVQPAYPGLRYNVCAMQTGLFFDRVFDGQSSITAAADAPPDPAPNFVGNDGFYDTRTGELFLGRMLAVAPWVANDPGIAHPSLELAERRAQLAAVGSQLLPGRKRAGAFRESVIWANLDL
ncbi:MAG TPA: nitrilase-related carbon-nitrogen hydrolase [Ktedonobacterales bacterium]